MKTNQDECENCGNPNLSHGGTWEGRPVCWECKQQGFFLADEQLERAEKAERERDEARALAIDLYLDANGVGPGRDWGAEEVPSWLSGEGGEVAA